MVRFSDMLGGDGEPENAPQDTAAKDEPLVAAGSPGLDAPADAIPPTAGELSPQELLDRLTQYATATRAGEPAAVDEPAPDATQADPDREPKGDDLLPRAKRSLRNPRGKRP